jgi:hypothetical protein
VVVADQSQPRAAGIAQRGELDLPNEVTLREIASGGRCEFMQLEVLAPSLEELKSDIDAVRL